MRKSCGTEEEDSCMLSQNCLNLYSFRRNIPIILTE